MLWDAAVPRLYCGNAAYRPWQCRILKCAGHLGRNGSYYGPLFLSFTSIWATVTPLSISLSPRRTTPPYLTRSRRLHRHCAVGCALVVLHRWPELQCFTGHHSSSWVEQLLSFPPHLRETKVKLYPSWIYAMEFVLCWIMVSSDIMIRIEAVLMDRLNQNGDSWLECHMCLR
jgi:hypothetical protein